jgi:hypothetical protein
LLNAPTVLSPRSSLRLAFALLIAVFAIAGEASARPVTAIWEPTGDPVTVGYRLYYGPSSGNYVIEIDVGNVTSRRLDLIPGIPYFFVVRAYNAAGVVGPPSNEFAVVLPNQAPVLLNPGNITIPPGPVAYRFLAGDPDGDPLTYTVLGLPPTVSVNTSTGVITGTLGPGTYTVTATASDGNLQSRQTFTVFVGATGCSAPAAPILNQPQVIGSQVAVSWQPPPAGAPPATSYAVLVGSGPGLANLAVIEAGLATSIAGNLPTGVYYVRAVGRNACGVSEASNEVSFTVGVPGAPAGLTFRRSGRTVTLSWAAPSGGASPTAYLVEVGNASGLANLLVYNTRSAARSLTATAPPGRFFVRIRALNGAVIGPPSNEVVITIP